MVEQPFVPSLRGDVQAAQGTYIRRPADDQLFAACLNNEFAYVLACRQIGKSSLKNAVAERLIGQGIRVARIDLNRIGQTVTGAEQWYFSLLDEIARNLELTTDAEEWWEQQSSLSTWAQRFLHFLDEVVLTEIKQPIVIFIDEIDMTLNLSFTNDLFAMIRSLYNDRAQNPAYRRLTFVLLGVASPDELIDDQKRTPFNVGKPISIRDFAQEECIPLRSYLEIHHPSKGSAYFDQIYQWTNGHPYLTQKLCHAVAQSAQSDDAQLVEALINEIFFKKGERTEDNLDFVQTRVLGDRYVVPMLQIYAKILRRRAVRDDKKSPAINRLQLYGLVVADQGRLHVRNKIYEKAFDQAWCKDNNPLNWTRIVAYSLACLLVLVIGWFGFALWHDNNIIPSQAQKAQLAFYQAHQPEERVKLLATLFRLDSEYILQRATTYDDQARALFFSMPNREEQVALFRVTDNNVLIVIKGLYMTLADVNETDRSTALLQVMADDLHKLTQSKETDDLLTEINHWVEGRNFSKQGKEQQGLDAYNKAIALNTTNLSTRYERAKLYFEVAQAEQPLDAQTSIEKALMDLDQIIAVLKQTDRSLATTSIPLPTPISTTTFTITPTTMPLKIPDNLMLGSPIPTPGIKNTSTITASVSPLAILPSSSMTPSSSATVISEFSRSDQILVAIRNLINNNNSSHTIDLVVNAKQEIFANLKAFGLAQSIAVTATLIPLPAPIPSGIVLSNAIDYVTRGLAYYNQGRTEEAIADYTKAIQLKADYADAYNNRGLVLADQGKLDAAIADYTKAIQLKADYAAAYNNRGLALSNQGRVDAAIADYTKAIQLKADYAAAYNNRGNALSNQDKLDTAIADYTKAIQFKADYAAAYFNRGLVLADQGRLDAAIADYNKAIQFKADYVVAYINRGGIYRDQGKPEEAIADYTKAIELKPNYALAYYGRGNAYRDQNKPEEAIADYTKAIQLQPDYAPAYAGRGNSFLDQHITEEAIADYTKAIQLQPDYAIAYRNRGLAFSDQGKIEEAIADYTKAIQLQPDYAVAYFNRGFALKTQGKGQSALSDLHKYLELQPQTTNRAKVEEAIAELEATLVKP